MQREALQRPPSFPFLHMGRVLIHNSTKQARKCSRGGGDRRYYLFCGNRAHPYLW